MKNYEMGDIIFLGDMVLVVLSIDHDTNKINVKGFDTLELAKEWIKSVKI